MATAISMISDSLQSSEPVDWQFYFINVHYVCELLLASPVWFKKHKQKSCLSFHLPLSDFHCRDLK